MNTQISVTNPLLQPIQYNGQTYITSQRLHAEYKNSEGAKKYELLKNFNRLIRSLEAYQSYIDKGDIVELPWKEAKITGSDFEPVYASISYKPLMLINATMQVALSHHLDDEISKTISVAVNTAAAKNEQADKKFIARMMKDMLEVAKMCGLEGNQALLGACKATKKLTGFSPLELLEMDLVAPVKEKLITPTDIGRQLGDLSAKAVNKLLEMQGYQESYRDLHNDLQWQPTAKGRPFGEMLDSGKKHSDGTPIKQWKWFTSIVDVLRI